MYIHDKYITNLSQTQMMMAEYILKWWWIERTATRRAGSKAWVCWGRALLSSLYNHQLESVVNLCSGKWQEVGCAGSPTPRGSRTRWALVGLNYNSIQGQVHPLWGHGILHQVWIHLMHGCLWHEMWLTRTDHKLNEFVFHICLRGIHCHIRYT
jgi:hypothetical protein